MKTTVLFAGLTLAWCLPAAAINFLVPTGTTETFDAPLIDAAIRKEGGGTLILGGTEDNAGTGANIIEGILELAKASSPTVHALGGTGAIGIQNGATLRLAGTGGDQIFDLAPISLNTSGTFDLNGRSERIRFYSGSGQILSSSGTGTFIFGTEDDFFGAAFATFSNGGGVLNVTKVGAGLWTLGGVSTHSGATTITAGTLRTASDYLLSEASTLDVHAGATLDLSGRSELIGGLAGAGTVLIGNNGVLYAGANHASTTFDGAVTSTASGLFFKTGAGTLTLGGPSDNAFLRGIVLQGTLVLAKQSSPSVHALGGDTTIDPSATLRLAGTGGDQILDAASLVIRGTLELQDRTETIASFSGAGAIDLGTGTLTAGNAANQIFSGVLSGAGSLVKVGSGALTLTGTNTHTGTLTAAGGILRLGSAGAIPAGSSLAVNVGAVVDLNGQSLTLPAIGGTGGAITLGGGSLTLGAQDATSLLAAAVNGPGTFTKTGAGTLTLLATSDIQGPVLIESGTLAVIGDNFAGNGNLGASAALTIAAGATFAANLGTASSDPIYVGSLSGAGAITRDPGLGLPPQRLRVGLNDASTTYSGDISASNLFLEKAGAGTLTLSGTNTLFGLQVIQGTVVLASDGAFTPGGILTMSGASTLDSGGRGLTAGGLFSAEGTLALGGGSLTTGGGAIYGMTLTGGGGFTKTGGDPLEIYGTVNVAGPLRFEGGTTTVFSPDSLPDAGAVTVTGLATLHFSYSNDTLGSLAGEGSLILEESTLTIGGSAATTFSGSLNGGNGSLIKAGTGTLTLAGSATHNGATAVTDGTLLVTGSIAGGVSVTGGTLGGTGTTGALTLQTGGAIAPGLSAGTLTAASLDWQGGTLVFELGSNPATSDRLALPGALGGSAGPKLFTFGNNGWVVGRTYDLITFGSTTLGIEQFAFTNLNGFAGLFAYNGAGDTLQFTLTAVPEPRAWGIALAAALAGLAFARRHRAPVPSA